MLGEVPPSREPNLKFKQIAILLALTVGALFIHGYHPCTEDAEIYLPGAEKIIRPELFPAYPEFFQFHAHLTLFPNLIAVSVRITHLPMEWVLFLWQVASVFLLLFACWELSGHCFTDDKARWAAVALVAALLTLPVAGTALYIMDQYVNPRNLTASLGVLAVARVLNRKYRTAGGLLVLAALFHPLMASFSLSYCVLLVLPRRYDPRFSAITVLLPLGFFAPPSEGYHRAALLHSFHYLTRWQWYEWLGAVAPLIILSWFSVLARRKRSATLELMRRALVVYGLLYFAAGLALSITTRFEGLARIQPMRSLHLLYILFFVLVGGFVGEYVLKTRLWRWLILFTPICAGMFVAQRALFPGSAHLEWPGAAPKNQWVQALVWIRENTPESAVFALDPYHLEIPGEDHNGFRAIAQRSRLADVIKDSGAVSMFPQLADEWLTQTENQKNWKNFHLSDLKLLRQKYGVSWVVLQPPGIAGLECPFHNQAVMVCALN